jgi:hypothetical protein
MSEAQVKRFFEQVQKDRKAVGSRQKGIGSRQRGGPVQWAVGTAMPPASSAAF